MAGQQWPPGPSLGGLFFGGRGLSHHHGFGVLFFLIDLGNMADDGNGDRGRELFHFLPCLIFLARSRGVYPRDGEGLG